MRRKNPDIASFDMLSASPDTSVLTRLLRMLTLTSWSKQSLPRAKILNSSVLGWLAEKRFREVAGL